MRERPILFSAPMVRAILAGRKTQTRRIVTVPWAKGSRALPYSPYYDDCDGVLMAADEYGDWHPYVERVACPYGVPGDRLWVRETWRPVSWTDDGDQVLITYPAGPTNGSAQAEAWCEVTGVEQLAHEDWLAREEARIEAAPMLCAPNRPSIFMPRWASRLTLGVTGVRVERLQEITGVDARAEGLDHVNDWASNSFGVKGVPGSWNASPRLAFASLWDLINGKRASWESNPFVWAVAFSVVPVADRSQG